MLLFFQQLNSSSLFEKVKLNKINREEVKPIVKYFLSKAKKNPNVLNSNHETGARLIDDDQSWRPGCALTGIRHSGLGGSVESALSF